MLFDPQSFLLAPLLFPFARRLGVRTARKVKTAGKHLTRRRVVFGVMDFFAAEPCTSHMRHPFTQTIETSFNRLGVRTARKVKTAGKHLTSFELEVELTARRKVVFGVTDVSAAKHNFGVTDVSAAKHKRIQGNRHVELTVRRRVVFGVTDVSTAKHKRIQSNIQGNRHVYVRISLISLEVALTLLVDAIEAVAEETERHVKAEWPSRRTW